MSVVYHKNSTHATQWGFVLAGFASLLSSAYYDVIRGPLLPAIAADLGLAFTGSGWFFAVGNAGGMLTTILLIWALNRWSERRVTVIASVLGIGFGLFALSVVSLAWLLVFAFGIGATVTLLGTMSNVLVLEGAPEPRKARFLAGLHTMYGAGSASAAALVGIMLAHGFHWSRLFVVGIPIFVGILLFAIWRMPGRDVRPSPPQPASLSKLQMLAVLVFSLYVVGEVTTSFWLTTYLVHVEGMDAPSASYMLTAYFLVLTAARVTCSLTLTPRRERLVLVLALTLPVLCLAAGLYGWRAGFVLTGLYGPFFPVFLARLSRLFPANWRSMLVWTITVMTGLIGVANLTLGRLADWLGLQKAFWLPPLLLAAAAAALCLYLYLEPKALAAARPLPRQ
jgi:MFS family permease